LETASLTPCLLGVGFAGRGRRSRPGRSPGFGHLGRDGNTEARGNMEARRAWRCRAFRHAAEARACMRRS
jgi:hypothetical protein